MGEHWAMAELLFPPDAGWLLAAALLIGIAATYVWRFLGVLLAGTQAPNSPVVEWVACIAYGLLAALIARMIVLPAGPLEVTGLGQRLICVGIALAAFYVTRRNVAVGVFAGSGLFAAWLYGIS